MSLPAFEPDFAAYYQWAEMYRACGLQVIPAYSPEEAPKAWKRPKLSEWTELQGELAPQSVWDRWYGVDGGHISRRNMGIITGACSGNVFVLDLDIHKNPQARAWWRALLEVENNGLDLETVRQITGGGGRQLLFRAPPGVVMPTCKTAIGVDVRGQGGFAMMPPSKHESGQEYAWVDGFAPWETEIAMAPQWLIDAVFDLTDDHAAAGGERTPDPATAVNEFGQVIDGREQIMRDVVWHAVLELYRASPIEPPQVKWREHAEVAYLRYESLVGGRGPIADRASALERDGRGATEFGRKWARAMKQWGSQRMVAAAARPNPNAATSGGLGLGPVPDPSKSNPTGAPLVLTSAEFVAGFKPPAYLVDGIIQRGYLYSFTAKTNHGKTAVAMYMAQAIALGAPMHGREVMGGTVLFLAGENSQDVRARFLVLAEAYGFDPGTIKMQFIDGVVDLAKRMPEIRAAADLIPDLVLVIVDTAVAYFPGDDQNSNAQQAAYARLLRELTTLRGLPAALVNCHPVKNAGRDNLLPVGGGAFVNEVDGNLTLWAVDKQTALHWSGKFRGPEFEQLVFDLETRLSDKVKDEKGRLMPSVVAVPVTEMGALVGEQTAEQDENRVLRLLDAEPGASMARIAERCGFLTVDGRPQKMRAHRMVHRLLGDKLVERYRGAKYRITKKGAREIGVDYENGE